MGVEQHVLEKPDIKRIEAVLDGCFFEFNYELDALLAKRMLYLIDTYSIDGILFSRERTDTKAINSTTICEDLRDIEIYFRDFGVYDELLKNPNLPSESIKSVYEQIDPNYWNANTDGEMHLLLTQIASHHNTSADILRECATWGSRTYSEPAAMAAVLNPNTPIDAACAMIKCQEVSIDFSDFLEEMREAIEARGYNPDTGQLLNPEPEKYTPTPGQMTLNFGH